MRGLAWLCVYEGWHGYVYARVGMAMYIRGLAWLCIYEGWHGYVYTRVGMAMCIRGLGVKSCQLFSPHI